MGTGATSVALDDLGNALAVWTTASGVQSAYLPADGTKSWQLAPVVSDSVRPTVSVVKGGAGAFTATWIRVPAGTSDCIVQVASFTPDNGWSAAASVSPPGECAVQASVGTDAGGDTIAGWQGPAAVGIYASTLPQIRVALRPVDGTWGSSDLLSPASRLQYVNYGGLTGVGVSGSGDATVVWYGANKAYAAFKAAGASGWTKRTIATYGKGPGYYPWTRINGELKFAMDDAGNAVAAFTLATIQSNGDTTLTLRTVVRPAGQSWANGGIAATDKLNGGGLFPALVVNPSGTFVIGWVPQGSLKTYGFLKTSTRTAATAWTAPLTVGYTFDYRLAQSKSEALAVWSDYADGGIAVSTLPLP